MYICVQYTYVCVTTNIRIRLAALQINNIICYLGKTVIAWDHYNNIMCVYTGMPFSIDGFHYNIIYSGVFMERVLGTRPPSEPKNKIL